MSGFGAGALRFTRALWDDQFVDVCTIEHNEASGEIRPGRESPPNWQETTDDQACIFYEASVASNNLGAGLDIQTDRRQYEMMLPNGVTIAPFDYRITSVRNVLGEERIAANLTIVTATVLDAGVHLTLREDR